VHPRAENTSAPKIMKVSFDYSACSRLFSKMDLADSGRRFIKTGTDALITPDCK
jgi:hypothetical protein